jgi:hypothetical protein
LTTSVFAVVKQMVLELIKMHKTYADFATYCNSGFSSTLCKAAIGYRLKPNGLKLCAKSYGGIAHRVVDR